MSDLVPANGENPLGFDARQMDGVHVLRFQNAKILSESSVSEMGRRLMTCLDAMPDPPRLALSFDGVQFLSSAGIGKLIMVQRRVKERGGELLLCDLNPTTQDAFRMAHLQDYFRIYPDVPSAVAALA